MKTFFRSAKQSELMVSRQTSRHFERTATDQTTEERQLGMSETELKMADAGRLQSGVH